MKTREPEDEHCVLWCTPIIHTNPIPLDTPKDHTALPYITWGLIWDSKIKRKESLRLRFFTGQASRTSKVRRRLQWKLKPEKYQLTKFYQTAVKDFKGKRKKLYMVKTQGKKKILVVKLIASENRKK